jgi:Ca2+-binding RTX toxin-like protein
MATFTGTSAGEIITPTTVSATVTANPPGSKPSNADDTINAGDGNDTIDSGGGNDTVTGGRGNDAASLGAGDDKYIWNPGDGSDTVDGGAGNDTLDFFGANVNEVITLTASGSHALFHRDVANITMDLTNVENVVFHAFGGADNITVGDLTGTGVTSVIVQLDAVVGTGTGDSQADTVSVNGTAQADTITVNGSGGTILVTGLTASVAITAVESIDTLLINGGNGDDVISLAGLATVAGVTIGAGAGNDTITGSINSDVILGGNGNDTVTGGRGDDIAILGAGSDTYIWNPGDGSDTVEGQGQTDTLIFNGSAASENFVLLSNGSRVLLTRDVGAVTMDLNGVEKLVINGAGGSDHLVVGNLLGTDMLGTITYNGGAGIDTVDASSAFTGMIITGGSGADNLTGGSADDVFRYLAGSDAIAGEVVSGGRGVNDSIQLFNTGDIDFTGVAISGVETLQFISGSSSAHFAEQQVGGAAGIENAAGSSGADRLIVSGSTIDLSTLIFTNWSDTQDTVTLVGTGGNDTLTGSSQRDVFSAGEGADAQFGGSGNDQFLYTAGSQASPGESIDGQSGSDSIGLSNTGAIDFTGVSIASVENLQFLGGTSSATFTGAQLGAGAITRIQGSSGADKIVVHDSAVNLSQVTFASWSSDDKVQITGTAGDDTLTGSRVADTISGGDGKDTITGGLGRDIMTGGGGKDVFIFKSLSDSGKTSATRDFITDFTHGPDKIDLKAIDASHKIAGDQAFHFIGTHAFNHIAGELHVIKIDNGGTAHDSTIIEGEVNGDGKADFEIQLKGLVSLTKADFIL